MQGFAEDEGCKRWLQDETVKSKLANAKKLADVNAKDYDAIFYIGGHGPVIDLPEDATNIQLASDVSRTKIPGFGGDLTRHVSFIKQERSPLQSAMDLRKLTPYDLS